MDTYTQPHKHTTPLETKTDLRGFITLIVDRNNLNPCPGGDGISDVPQGAFQG